MDLDNATYVSWARFHQDLPYFCDQLPPDTVGLIGIPRSGMMVASLMGLHMNLPVGDVYSFVRSGSLWSVGRKFANQPVAEKGTLVIVDDSLNTGKSMLEAVDMVSEAVQPQMRVRTASMYTTSEKRDAVDYCSCEIPMPRAFAWNWHAKRAAQHWMLDVDNALYKQRALPFRPMFAFGWVVSHLANEKVFTDMLAKDGVSHVHQTMFLDCDPDEGFRHKIQIYSELEAAKLFVTGTSEQAYAVYNACGKAALSVDDDQLVS